MTFVKPSDTVTVQFTVTDPATGSTTDADSLPTGTLIRNGADTGETVTIQNVTTGVYSAAVTIPAGYAAGDEVQLRIAATVGGVAGQGVVWSAQVDTVRVGELNDLTAAQVNAEVDTALADYDAPTQAELLSESGDIQALLQAAMSVDEAAPGVGNYDPATDSLEAIRNRGDTAWVTGGTGSGAISFTYTLTEPPEGSGTPIADAEVAVFTDEAMTNNITIGRTDAFGQVTFLLDPGTYYLRRKKSGFTFTNPDTEVVS